jgi:hypothetical protein
MLADFSRDLDYSVRKLGKNMGFTFVVVISLAFDWKNLSEVVGKLKRHTLECGQTAVPGL